MTDDDLTARVRDSFVRQGAMATIGATLYQVAPGRDGKAIELGEGFAANKLIATMTATVMTVQGRDGLSR